MKTSRSRPQIERGARFEQPALPGPSAEFEHPQQIRDSRSNGAEQACLARSNVQRAVDGCISRASTGRGM
jgi:hypothetical protein